MTWPDCDYPTSCGLHHDEPQHGGCRCPCHRIKAEGEERVRALHESLLITLDPPEPVDYCSDCGAEIQGRHGACPAALLADEPPEEDAG